MEKIGIRIAVSAFAFLASLAGALTPRAASEYALRVPRAPTTFVATASNAEGDALAVFVWPSYAGEPSPGTLAVLRGEDQPWELSTLWSAALDESWQRLAVGEQVQVIDNTVEPPFSRVSLLCRELGMNAESLERSLYYDGFTGNGYVTRPVVYDLDSDDREALPLAGGDFIDWAGESRLVIGRETSTSKAPGVSSLELYGYNLDNGAVTLLAGVDEVLDKLADKLSADVRDSPYLPAAWRLASIPEGRVGSPAVEFAVPARGGAFENGGNGFSWRPDGGEAVFVARGFVVAANADATWVVTYGAGEKKPLTALRLEWE